MMYKNWIIVENEFGYYEANKIDNSNENYLYAKTVDGIKTEIEEELKQ